VPNPSWTPPPAQAAHDPMDLLEPQR